MVGGTKKQRRRTTGTGGSSGFPAQWFTAYRALLGAMLVPPSPAGRIPQLGACIERQNHTTSPSAATSAVLSTLRVHRIPSRVRDDASALLSRRDDVGKPPSRTQGKRIIFAARDWTTQIAFEPATRNRIFTRKAIRRLKCHGARKARSRTPLISPTGRRTIATRFGSEAREGAPAQRACRTKFDTSGQNQRHLTSRNMSLPRGCVA